MLMEPPIVYFLFGDNAYLAADNDRFTSFIIALVRRHIAVQDFMTLRFWNGGTLARRGDFKHKAIMTDAIEDSMLVKKRHC